MMARGASSSSSGIPPHEEYVLRHIQHRLRLLKWELKTLESLEIDQSSSKGITKEQQCALLRKPLVCALLQEFTLLLGLPSAPLHSNLATHDLCFHSFQVEPRDKGRYLCVSFGFMICCLNLRQGVDESKDCRCSDLRPLPKISTLKLLEKGNPVSMGLFKLGSHAYMVGGQEFVGFNKNPPYLWDWDLFDFLYTKYGAKGTYRDTHHLFVADSSLSLSECNFIGPLNKPKIWPIVEKIGDKIHVIESLPRALISNIPRTIPTHEVLNLSDLKRGWMELSPVCFPDDENLGMYIYNHIVVGGRIYAYPFNTRDIAVFDSKTSKWKLHDFGTNERELRYEPVYPSCVPFSINHVSQILRFGCGRCVGGFPRGELRDPLYVLIALGYDACMKMIAVAYLVTLTGQVLCFQKLPHFLEKFDRSFDGVEARVINVDEDGETHCAIFQGITHDTCEHFLFISTFTWEEVEDANAVVQDLRSQRCDEDDVGKLPYAIEKVFVNVVVKDMFVYTKEVDPMVTDIRSGLPGVSACFL